MTTITLPTSRYAARWAVVEWMQAARRGLAANDGTFGGPDGCRRVLLNCEAEIVARPEPWPWHAKTGGAA
jgi:hypothetical protein